MTHAIEVRNLVRDFGRVRALDRLSFEVPPGIVFGFLGPNGAGKTTLIRVLLGLVSPTSGDARVFGLDPASEGADARARTGALLEHHGLYERLTALQNLAFHARAWRLPPDDAAARMKELLQRFGLWDRRTDRAGTWSRGMKQKLAVARAVLHRPPLVFLDEPTAGLDPVASAALREDIARLARDEGVTVFLTTHNLAEAERLCTLVGVIRRGHLLACDSPAALRARRRATAIRVRATGWTAALRMALGVHPDVASAEGEGDEARLVLQSAGRTPAIVAWMVDQGLEVEEVVADQATFEQTFLELVEADASGGADAG